MQKGKADFALIAQGRQVRKGLKITHVIWGKSADKHFYRELHTQGFELVTKTFSALSHGDGVVRFCLHKFDCSYSFVIL